MASSATGFEETARTIRDMDSEFVRNVRTKNVSDLVNAFYAEDARVLPPNQPIVSGKAAILAHWNSVMAYGLSDLALDTTHIEVSGELAYGVGNYTMTVNPQGGAPATDKGKYCVVYRRQPDRSWKAVADMFSSNGGQ